MQDFTVTDRPESWPDLECLSLLPFRGMDIAAVFRGHIEFLNVAPPPRAGRHRRFHGPRRNPLHLNPAGRLRGRPSRNPGTGRRREPRLPREAGRGLRSIRGRRLVFIRLSLRWSRGPDGLVRARNPGRRAASGQQTWESCAGEGLITVLLGSRTADALLDVSCNELGQRKDVDVALELQSDLPPSR